MSDATSQRRTSVLMVYDIEGWILEEIGQRLQRRLEPGMAVDLVCASSPGAHRRLRGLQRSVDLVHFLSPWNFFDFRRWLSRPTAVTVWHLTRWDRFDAHRDRVDALLIASRQWRRRMAARLGPAGLPIHPMPFGVDGEEFRPREGARDRFVRSHAVPAGALVLGCAASRLSDEDGRKGFDRLWSLARDLRAAVRLPLVVRVIGPGWDDRHVPHDLRGCVVVGGTIDRGELPEFYSSLDAYVCPSREEGVPYPVLEAMSCGCPVVTTPVGIVPELVVSGRNGLIVPVERWDSSSAAIAEFVLAHRDPDSELRRRGRESVVPAYDWRQVDVSGLRYAYEACQRAFRLRTSAARAAMVASREIRYLRWWLRTRSGSGGRG